VPKRIRFAELAKPLPAKHSVLGRRLRAGLDEVPEHLRGEIKLTDYDKLESFEVELLRLRVRFGLSQARFARAFGLDVTAVAAWEQGRRRPNRMACILFAVIAHEPEAVRRALAA